MEKEDWGDGRKGGPLLHLDSVYLNVQIIFFLRNGENVSEEADN